MYSYTHSKYSHYLKFGIQGQAPVSATRDSDILKLQIQKGVTLSGQKAKLKHFALFFCYVIGYDLSVAKNN